MCLDRVSNTVRKKDAVGFGYKAYYQYRGNLYNPYYATTKPRKTGVWIGSRNMGWYGSHYPKGHHVFRRRGDAEDWANIHDAIVKRVKFRDRLAQGKQIMWRNGRWKSIPVIVAKEIFIEP